MHLPMNRSEVTETWLLDTLSVLQEFLADPVDSIRLEPMNDGIGQLSIMVIADLVLVSGKKLQLIIKLQTDVPSMHDIGLRYGYYENEVNFYRFFSDKVPMRTPTVFVAEFDRAAGRVLLIMESFSGWHSQDQVKGASLEQITTATRSLAGLTAAFWNTPLQEEHSWIHSLTSEVFSNIANDYRESVEEALNRLNGSLPESAAANARKIGGCFDDLIIRLSEGNQALAHWDYRVENFFYGPNSEFVVIDWQLMMMTRPAADLAYLLGTNIDPELRRSSENELMEIYLEELARHGVTDYSRMQLEQDYRLGMLGASGIPIIGGAGVDRTNARSSSLFQAMGGRLFQAIEDWDAMALLTD
jgi:hypothetical protein